MRSKTINRKEGEEGAGPEALPLDCMAEIEKHLTRLIKHYEYKITCYPAWIKMIQDEHISNEYKNQRIKEQEQKRADDKIILLTLKYYLDMYLYA